MPGDSSGCTPKGLYGNTASEKVLGSLLGQKGFEKGACYGSYSIKKRGSEKGSQKGF